MVFRGVECGAWSDKRAKRIIKVLMLGGYANAPGMAYLEANGWSLRKTVYIWGRRVENVEWAIRHENISPTDRTDRHRRETPSVFV